MNARKIAALGILLTVACVTSDERAVEPGTASSGGVEAPMPVAPPHRGPWTDAFMKNAVLIADVVQIEGPAGVFDHVATRPDPDFHERVDKTVPDGFLQEITVKTTELGSEVRAWVDRLEIVAMRRLRIHERPGASQVVVSASGDVYWREIETAREERSETFELVGKLAR